MSLLTSPLSPSKPALSSALAVLPVHLAFARQAAADPARVALHHGLRSTRYGELDAQAEAIATALAAAGVRPGDFVGIGLQRSAEQIACLLGVLKAGAAFVPIDPELPAARRAAMAGDAGVRLIVGEAGDDELTCAPTVTLDALRVGMAQLADPLHVVVDARTQAGAEQSTDAAAYVLYTSGSTGQPKGVRVDHAALALRLAGMQQVLPLTEADRFLQRTALGFDVAIEEVFWPLGIGASLVLAEPREQMDAAALVSRIAHQQVSVADFVPSLLERVLVQPGLRECTALRRVLCGGEAMSATLMANCLRTLPTTELVNVYGPTEAVINALVWKAHAGHDGPPPIGRPLPHTRAVVLDETQQPVPPGQIGELWLGGVLAHGYLGAPELTRARFVADPQHPGERRYRTGDLARLRSDGELEFHGRIDRQVKLRGARIELGEIEAALLAHAEVRQACVVMHGEGAQARLVAYVASDVRQSATRWREQLSEALPRHMLPSAWVRLDALPLTRVGKLDLKALPAPPAQRKRAATKAKPTAIEAVSDATSATPAPASAQTSALSDTIRHLFARLLAGTEPSEDDDFFELGGDSLQATELLTELDEVTGLDLSLQTLYEHPSAAALVRHIEAASAAHTGGHFNLAREFAEPERSTAASRTPNLVQLQKGSGHAAAQRLFCIHPGDGGSSMYLPLVRLMRARPTVCALTAWDLRRRHWPQATVQAIAADYVAQVRELQPDGPYHLLGWSSGAVLAYEMAQQLEAAGAQLGAIHLVDPFEPWEEGRLPPDAPRPAPDAPFTDDDWRMVLMMLALDACVPPPEHAFWGWPQPQRYDWVRESAHAIGRFPARLDIAAFVYLCQVVRLHCQAYDRYEPTHAGFDFTLFLPSAADHYDFNARCWPPLSTGRCAIVPTGGDHLSMMRAPHVQAVAQVLDAVFAAPSFSVDVLR